MADYESTDLAGAATLAAWAGGYDDETPTLAELRQNHDDEYFEWVDRYEEYEA